MTVVVWRIRLSAPAERDFLHIVHYTQDHFGTRQAGIYRKLITDSLAALQDGPDLPGSLSRDEIQPGLRSLHIAKRGKSARHVASIGQAMAM
jgi:toxin ParE1/3/4